MSTQKLSNVSLNDYRSFLKKAGCTCISTNGGHEKWVRKDLTRPIIVQTHISIVPEFIIMNGLRTLNLKKRDFFNLLFDCNVEDGKNLIKIEGVLGDDEPCYCGSGVVYSRCHKLYDLRNE